MDRAFVERLIEDLSKLRDALPRERPVSEVEVEVARAQWLASILAHVPDIISIIDPDGTLLYVSRSMGQGDARRLIGSSSVNYVPPSHRDAWNEAIRRAVDSGEPQHVEIFSVGDLWWDTRLVPIRHKGNVTWLVTIGTDVTARKRAEAELAINQQQLKLALEASGMGQWSWDLTTNRVTWDAATKRMFEWPVDDDNRQAVDMFERRRDDIDLVILDAVMPVMGGIEALARIRALRPDVAALVCSGYSEELHRLSERDTKAAFLAKPYEPDRLLRVVRTQLDARTRPRVKPA